jgi:hypothetical protein
MVEEHFVAGAKVIQPVFSRRSLDKALLRTAPVADETDFALSAILG